MFIRTRQTNEVQAIAPAAKPLDRPKYFLVQLPHCVLSRFRAPYPGSPNNTQVFVDNGYVDGDTVWIKTHSFPDVFTGFYRPAGGSALTFAADKILVVLPDDTTVKMKARDSAAIPPLAELAKLPFIHFFPSDGEIIVTEA